MLCPICKSGLSVTGQARLETLCEHVCDPNGTPPMKDKYQCINKECEAYKDSLTWNRGGEYYSGDNFRKKYDFIENNNGPFGSHERQMHIEIYKKDENFQLINLYWFKYHVCFNYKADEDGNILKRTWNIETYKKDSNHYVHYTSPIRMFFSCLRSFKFDLKRYYNGKMSLEYARNALYDEFSHATEVYNDELYRKVFYYYLFMFYNKLSIELGERQISVDTFAKRYSPTRKNISLYMNDKSEEIRKAAVQWYKKNR